jgi:hypothetical protein
MRVATTFWFLNFTVVFVKGLVLLFLCAAQYYVTCMFFKKTKMKEVILILFVYEYLLRTTVYNNVSKKKLYILILEILWDLN